MGIFSKIFDNCKRDHDKEKTESKFTCVDPAQMEKSIRAAKNHTTEKAASKKTVTRGGSITKSTYRPVQEHVLSDYTFIKDEFLNSPMALKRLGDLVCPSVPSGQRTTRKLVSSAKSILDTTSGHAEKFYSRALMETDPKKFFDDIDVCNKDYARMAEIERYVYYGGRPSNIAKYHMDNRLQIEIRHLIDRAAAAAKEAPDPDAAMQKAYCQLKEFEKRMDEQSQKKLNSKFRKYIS